MSKFISALISQLLSYFIQALIKRCGCRNLLIVIVTIGIIFFILSKLPR